MIFVGFNNFYECDIIYLFIYLFILNTNWQAQRRTSPLRKSSVYVSNTSYNGYVYFKIIKPVKICFYIFLSMKLLEYKRKRDLKRRQFVVVRTKDIIKCTRMTARISCAKIHCFIYCFLEQKRSDEEVS